MHEPGMINNIEERQKLELSSENQEMEPITYDSDYLPEYAVEKKVRWSRKRDMAVDAETCNHYVNL
jgi:hypothetical protein